MRPVLALYLAKPARADGSNRERRNAGVELAAALPAERERPRDEPNEAAAMMLAVLAEFHSIAIPQKSAASTMPPMMSEGLMGRVLLHERWRRGPVAE